MSIGILCHPDEAESVQPALERLKSQQISAWRLGAATDEEMEAHPDAELLVAVGGDGTFLLASRLASKADIPVMGVNRGKLGFLTDVELPDLDRAVASFLDGTAPREQHRLLAYSLAGEDGTEKSGVAVNDVVVRAPRIAAIRISVRTDGELLGDFDADGLVIATALGSTGYALSGGGPPIDPRIQGIVFVPLAPHAVVSRAIVLPNTVSLRLTVEKGPAFLATDGDQQALLGDDAEIAVTPGPFITVLRSPQGASWLQRLRTKARYGIPLRDSVEGRGNRHRQQTLLAGGESVTD